RLMMAIIYTVESIGSRKCAAFISAEWSPPLAGRRQAIRKIKTGYEMSEENPTPIILKAFRYQFPFNV
ncbi:MAG: hypothetical protein ACOYLM_13335, partial [Methylococcaceae bacterium]